MTDATRLMPEDEPTRRQILSAQALAVLDGVVLSLAANCFLAATTAAVLWLDEPGASILAWLSAVFAINLARYMGVRIVRRLNCAVERPKRALGVLSLGALGGGLAWSLPPFIGILQGTNGLNPYLIFIIGGICAGSLMQSMAYSRTALLFAGPPLAAAILSLLITGTSAALVIAADALLLAVMMLRASQLSEAGFIRSQIDRLKAVALAASLSDANGEIRQSYQQLASLANRDPLTGLGNRALFNQRLRDLMDDSVPTGTLALLVIDLDRFKAINDTMGHGAGDAVLTEIASRLAGLTRPTDTVVRLGGDEFAVIIEGYAAEARGREIGDGIVRLAGDPIVVGGRPVTVGASAGLALYPQHGETADDLFASADIALYAAKEGGRRRLGLFNPILKARIERQRLIEATLTDAIEDRALRVVFQPQVELATGRVTGFEALLRWMHPELGAVSPPDIVRAAHALHISTALTGYVANCAAEFLRTLPRLGLPEAAVAVNVSPREFSGDTLSRLLTDIARAHDVSPALMEIEITEEATLDTQAAGAELARLEAAGFRLAVDDFGMGHSSLAYLVSLHIDRLKIDRSFVKGIATSRENQALIAALIGIGHALSIDIVVEGVEDEEEAEVLRMLGCRHAQGYHFARPMPAEDIPRWLDQHTERMALRLAGTP
ncbi:EAL domain-containing protein [Shinella sp. CPCC 101442]|uniref:putative bifunctional diguanylate cyclase/phosphodiesterase n=1 Tax=Shinella sp. CPCC 101442 TaxID=2932265 RepID=UPI002152F8B4|nr:EAL domain-containing protein [Shinella sp. CPCC 101442]MCR6499720.1 EAL domain-containing protein [Shinella sp. CPCC 101442]